MSSSERGTLDLGKRDEEESEGWSGCAPHMLCGDVETSGRSSKPDVVPQRPEDL